MTKVETLFTASDLIHYARGERLPAEHTFSGRVTNTLTLGFLHSRLGLSGFIMWAGISDDSGAGCGAATACATGKGCPCFTMPSRTKSG